MHYNTLAHSNLKVSALALGTMTFGEQNSETEAHNQLDYALEHGINFIDTAEMYPVPPQVSTHARTEKIIGTWIKKQARERIVLATKIAGLGRNMTWIRGGPEALDRTGIRMAVNGSLQRLQTDYIDLYQIHWPARNVPMFGQYKFDPEREYHMLNTEQQRAFITEQLEAFAELISEGKIRYIGLSNEQPWGLMTFLNVARECNLPRIVSLQNCYNLINRTLEFGTSEILYRENIALLAYSPLAFGHLSGKYILHPNNEGRVNRFPGFAQRYTKPGVAKAVLEYMQLAADHGLTAVQLALAFVYQRWFVTSTILGATTMAQLQENIMAFEVPTLSAEILQSIETLHLTMMNPAP